MTPEEEKQIIEIWEEFAELDYHYVTNSGELSKLDFKEEDRRDDISNRRRTLERFLEEDISLEEFKSKTLGQAQHHLWGFAGPGGGMFFNLVVDAASSVPDVDLASVLRDVLRPPEDRAGAADSIRKFEEVVKMVGETVDNSHKTPTPVHTPYFLSYFWQLYGPDQYPIYYTSLRDGLEELGLWEPTGNLAQDYVSFWDINEDIRDTLDDHRSEETHLWWIERMFLFWNERDRVRKEIGGSNNGFDLSNLDHTDQRVWRVLWLKERYDDAIDWVEIRDAADHTSKAITTLLEAIIRDLDRVGTSELTALYRLCQHSQRTSVTAKIEKVEELNLSEESTENVLKQIDERIGSVGGLRFDKQVPDEETALQLHDVFERILETDEREALDSIVEELAELNIEGLQSGSLSPILHYLHPSEYPIINGATITGMQKYFDTNFSSSFDRYLEHVDKFREIRDEFGFREHYRDLDYLFVWADGLDQPADHNWTWMLTEEGETDRDVYAIQPGATGVREALWEAWRNREFVSVGGEYGDLRELSDELISEYDAESGWGAKQAWEIMLSMDPGDIVVVKKGQNDLWGLGVVKPSSYEYLEGGPGYVHEGDEIVEKHPHIRWVDWVVVADAGWSVDQLGLSRKFGRETAYTYRYYDELRYRAGHHIPDGVKVFEKLELVSRHHHGAEENGPPWTGRIYVDHEYSEDDLGEEQLLAELHFPYKEELLDRIRAAIRSGKHIVFTGPPGTGKTELAERICQTLTSIEKGPFTDYQLTTATADWTTFDTVGGRIPAAESDRLEFKPGIVLNCFKDINGPGAISPDGGQEKNELLIIDELNRADIDKAFGQIFTLLSGQAVSLPFEIEGQPVEIIPWAEFTSERPDAHEFVVPPEWRILATMNSYDKTSLYEMSYAFMRRFAFINVPVPEVRAKEAADGAIEFMNPYLSVWFELDEDRIDADLLDETERLPSVEDIEGVVAVWRQLTSGEHTRPIGPALVEDMLRFMASHEGDAPNRLGDAVVAYVYPQLEGVPDRSDIISGLVELEHLQDVSGDLRTTAIDMLDANFSGQRGEI